MLLELRVIVVVERFVQDSRVVKAWWGVCIKFASGHSAIIETINCFVPHSLPVGVASDDFL